MFHLRQNDNYIHLCEAIIQGDARTVHNLIQNDVSVNNPNVTGNTPLHLAIINIKGSKEIMIMLLERGANIHAKNHHNHTPLEVAIQHNKTEAALLLITRAREVFVYVAKNLNSLLLMAIEQIGNEHGNDHAIVKILIATGMQYDPLINLTTSLKAAICKGHLDIIKQIKPHCRFLKPSDQYIPKEAVISSDPKYEKCVELLLKWNFTINPDSYHDEDFIYSAVEKGYVPIVLHLLKIGIDVNIENSRTGLNLLTIACLNKHHEIVENLLKHNARVNVIISGKNKILNNQLRTDYNTHIFNRSLSLVDNEDNLYDLTCLHIAVINSDPMMTKILLRHGAKLIDDPKFFNITCIAIRLNCEKTVRIFLDHGVDVTDINLQEKTLLHFCILSDNDGQDFRCNIAKLLLEKGANIHIQTPDNTLVFEAINNRHRKIAQLFLDYNADIKHITDIQSPDGDTPLHKTISYSFDVKFIKALLKHNSPVNAVNKKTLTPLLIACKVKSQHQLGIVKALLDHHANVNCTDNSLMTPLHFVCQTHNLELITVLLENGANSNARNAEDQTPLHIICKYNNDITANIMQLLLNYNANIEAVDAKGWTPLFVACNVTNHVAVKYLLDKHANSNATNNEGQTPLHLVCKYECNMTASIIKLLLQHNANIEAVDTKGRTSLFTACETGNDVAVKCLLNNHANVNHTDLEKLTPLYVAVQNCAYHPEVVKMLLERQINIHVIDKWGNSIIHIIAENNNAELIESLAYTPVNFNSVNKQGSTPLHIAVGNQSIEVTRRLIKYGADVNILGEKNQTPLQNAIENMLYNENEIKGHRDYFQRWYRASSCRVDDNDDFNPYTNRVYNYKEIIKILKTQVIKLKVAGLKINTHNLDIVYDSNDCTTKEFSELNMKCEQEIEKMRTSNGIDNITFYDLLKKNIHFLSRFVKNKKIYKTLKQKVYDNKFPLYIDIVRNRFHDAQFRYRLVNFAKMCFSLNINSLLPDNCIDTLFSYLSVNELNIFIEAMRPSKG